jgi:hypothetical protein
VKQRHDKQYYRDLVGDAWERLRDGYRGDPRTFRAYCDALLEVRSKQVLQDEWVAMAIAHAMFVPHLDDDPLCEEITMIAGELEDVRPSEEKAALWRKLEQTIQELPNKRSG